MEVQTSSRVKAAHAATPSDLVSTHHKWVKAVVNSLTHALDLPEKFYDDYLAVGYLGLVEAASRYNRLSGTDFKRFAYIRIRGAVIDCIRESADSSGKAYRFAKALQAAQSFQEHGEILQSLGIGTQSDAGPSEAFEFISKGILAFRLCVADSEDELHLELGSPPTPEDVFSSKARWHKIKAAIQSLPLKEKIVIEEFYFQDRLFTEIATRHGLTKSWVIRLHTQALSRLKELL